jgi:hypothetical protein
MRRYALTRERAVTVRVRQIGFHPLKKNQVPQINNKQRNAAGCDTGDK